MWFRKLIKCSLLILPLGLEIFSAGAVTLDVPPGQDAFFNLAKRTQYDGNVLYNYCDKRNRYRGGTLHFQSFNVGDGDPGGSSPDTIRDAVGGWGFDILALQEVDLGDIRSGNDRDLADEIAKKYHLCGIFVAGSDFTGTLLRPLGAGRGRQGVVLLSRYPVTDWSAHKLPESQHPWYGSGADHGEQRSSAQITILKYGPHGEVPIHLIATHLSVPDDDRAREVADLKQRYSLYYGTHTVLLGDLNSPSGNPDIQLLERKARRHNFINFDDANSLLGIPPIPTSPLGPGVKPNVQIDHIMFHGCWKVTGFNTWPSTASDHLPIVAEATPTEGC